jgi:hypothetical protein
VETGDLNVAGSRMEIRLYVLLHVKISVDTTQIEFMI